MSEPITIPYVGYHTGPKRTLYLQLTEPGLAIRPWTPIIGLDGLSYVATWGLIAFEIPADRPVHLSVHMDGEYMTKVATAVIRPSEGYLELRYEGGELHDVTTPS